MNRLVRVILTATVGGFLRGIGQAQNLFTRFVRGVSTGTVLISQALQGLQAGVNLVMGAIRSAVNLARTFHDSWLENSFVLERTRITLEEVTGSTASANEMMARMNETSLDLGISMQELAPAGQQMALAIKGAEGAVNIDRWQEYLNILTLLTRAFPNVPGGAQAFGRAVSAFMAGETRTLEMLLDLDLTNQQFLSGLSQETQNFLRAQESLGEQQLGTVTRLGESTVGNAGDALAALEEILAAFGLSTDLLEEYSNTTEGLLGQLEARWEAFKAKVVAELQPIVDEALQDIIDFIDEHEEDIDRFISMLGDVATEGWADLKEIIETTDWEQVGRDIRETFESAERVLERVVELLDQIREFFVGDWANVFPDSPFAEWMDNTFGPGGPLAGGPGATGNLFAPTETDLERGAQRREFLWQTERGGTFAQQAQSTAGRDENPVADALRDWFGNINVNVEVTVDEDGRLQVRRIAQEESNNAVGRFTDAAVGRGGGRRP